MSQTVQLQFVYHVLEKEKKIAYNICWPEISATRLGIDAKI